MSDVHHPTREELIAHLETVLESYAGHAATGMEMQPTTRALAGDLADMMIRLAADSAAHGEARGIRLAGAVASGAVH